jgi:hypothetical protein
MVEGDKIWGSQLLLDHGRKSRILGLIWRPFTLTLMKKL